MQEKTQIDPAQFQKRAEFQFNSFFIIAPAGVRLGTLLSAEPWRDVAERETVKLLEPYAIIRVRASDGSYDVQLTVVGKRKDGTPILQLFPRGEPVVAQQPAINPPATPKSRADAIDVLGLHASASDELIAKTASALRQSWHPDHATGPADRALRTEKCARINAAVDLLKLKAA